MKKRFFQFNSLFRQLNFISFSYVSFLVFFLTSLLLVELSLLKAFTLCMDELNNPSSLDPDQISIDSIEMLDDSQLIREHPRFDLVNVETLYGVQTTQEYIGILGDSNLRLVEVKLTPSWITRGNLLVESTIDLTRSHVETPNAAEQDPINIQSRDLRLGYWRGNLKFFLDDRVHGRILVIDHRPTSVPYLKAFLARREPFAVSKILTPKESIFDILYEDGNLSFALFCTTIVIIVGTAAVEFFVRS